MLSVPEFSTNFIEKVKEANAHAITPTSLAPHAAGYMTTAEKMLAGTAGTQLTPAGKGALKGSFLWKQPEFG